MNQARACPSPLSWETFVAYRANDLPASEAEAVELHILSCDECAAEAERVASVTEALHPKVARPVLRALDGERKDAPVRPRAVSPPRRRWFLGAAGGAALAAAAALFVLGPRGGNVATLHLPPVVRDAASVELTPPAGARELRLVPDTDGPATANGARLRSVETGRWLAIRFEPGPPLAVLAAAADLVPGRYDLELLSTTPDGRQESRGVYRFRIAAPRP